VYLLTKALKLVLFIKFLSILIMHTGATCDQPVELAKDWSNDCLEGQNLLVVELCGVLGRLHSNQGLAQSSNNAKLNYSAKQRNKAAGTQSAKVSKTSWEGKRKSKKGKKETGRARAARQEKIGRHPSYVRPPFFAFPIIFVLSLSCFYFPFFTFQTTHGRALRESHTRVGATFGGWRDRRHVRVLRFILLHNGTRQGGNIAKGCPRRDAKHVAKEARCEGDAPR
jgi:hypothetical protein